MPCVHACSCVTTTQRTNLGATRLTHPALPCPRIIPPAERIWRWLEGSGPPFDNPPPSLGVPTVSKTNLASASRRQGTKRSFFSCFNCFGGGGTR